MGGYFPSITPSTAGHGVRVRKTSRNGEAGIPNKREYPERSHPNKRVGKAEEKYPSEESMATPKRGGTARGQRPLSFIKILLQVRVRFYSGLGFLLDNFDLSINATTQKNAISKRSIQ